jgi:hypothetical protein
MQARFNVRRTSILQSILNEAANLRKSWSVQAKAQLKEALT